MADGLQIRQFNSDLYPMLAEVADAAHVPALLNRAFVDHYYLGQQWNKLFLVVNPSRCLGSIGIDIMQFCLNGELLTMAFATNFYSLQSGVGGMLWLKSIQMAEMGLVFGGSQDTHRIVRARNFDYYSGIHLYRVNARFESYEDDSFVKGMVKAALRPWARKKLSEYASKNFLRRFADIAVVERQDISERMLARNTPFSFRCCPPLDYLQWRYNSRLEHVRYRIFEILRSGQSCGYCVLNDGPTDLIVSYSDGDDPELLAAGILKAIFLVGEGSDRYRKAVLASSHPAMQALFTASGFHLTNENYPFAAGARKAARKLGDPKTWLINFGIGDNDLRPHMFWPVGQSQP